jgi:tetratricopeptide (TPR) repeat protein
MLCALQRFEEADAQLAKAVALDPLVPITLSERAVVLYYKGELDAALTAFSALKREHPTFAPSYIFSARIYGMKGDERNAFENEIVYLKMQGTEEETLKDMTIAFEDKGHAAFLAKVAEGNIRAAGEGAFPQYKFAHAFARLHDREKTLFWIERCLDARSPNIIKIASDKSFDFLRDDPRFKAALVRLNFPL